MQSAVTVSTPPVHAGFCASFKAISLKVSVPKLASSRNMPMRKPKSPMRLTTKAFLPASAAVFFWNQKPISRYDARPTPSHPTNISSALPARTSVVMKKRKRFRYEK